MSANEPFAARYDLDVPGGALYVARSGEPRAGSHTIVAAHGVTASHLAWRAVARELLDDSSVCLLAPDLRGRGRSAGLPGPYGYAAHVNDLLAVLDDAGVDRAVFAGHSMGAYVAVRAAAEHPDRVTALVLLDGGVPLPPPDDEDPEAVLAKLVGPAIARLHATYATREDYIAQWRAHPALAGAWNDDLELYAGYDLAGEAGAMRCVVSEAAVRADSADLLHDDAGGAALARVRAPVYLVRAARGFRDEPDSPFIPLEALEAFAAAHPAAHVATVEGVNHYTLTLGEGPGPATVAGAIRNALRDAEPAAT
jgi:lipase